MNPIILQVKVQKKWLWWRFYGWLDLSPYFVRVGDYKFEGRARWKAALRLDTYLGRLMTVREPFQVKIGDEVKLWYLRSYEVGCKEAHYLRFKLEFDKGAML